MTSRVTSARGTQLAAAVGRAMGISGASPERLQETSLGSRIVATCDTFAALTSDGPDAPLPDVDALDGLREGAAGGVDPTIVNVLVDVLWPARAPFPRE